MHNVIWVSVAVFPDGTTFWTDAGHDHAMRAIQRWRQDNPDYFELHSRLVRLPMRVEDYTRKVPATVDAARLAV